MRKRPTAEDKQAAEAVKAEGNAAFKGSRWGEAIDKYTEAIELDPTNPGYYSNRAAAYMSLKKHQLALADCQEANKLQGDSVAKTLVRTARCHFHLGHTTQAQAILGKIIDGASSSTSSSSAAPFSKEDAASAAQLLAQVKRLQGHLDQYEGYRAQKKWTLANLALDHAIQEIGGQSPSVPRGWRISKADLLLRKGQLDAAQSAVTDLLRADAQNSDALGLRARVLFAQGELAKSIAHAQAALRSDPDCVAARSLMRKAKKLEGVKAEGNAAFKAGQAEEAIARYSEAIALADENAEEDGEPTAFKAALHSNRASANAKLERWEEVARDCDAALALQPAYVKALKTRARANGKLERYEEAVRDFKEAIEQSGVSSEGTAELEALKRELRGAEIDLKRSKQKDYYKILGVSKDANDAEIKKAYRKESLKHHPDKGGDEEKFKLTNEAFSVLSDETKRRRYDMGADDVTSDLGGGGGNPFGGMGGGFPMGGFGGGGVDIDLSDILGGMGGGMGGGGFGGMPGPASAVQAALWRRCGPQASATGLLFLETGVRNAACKGGHATTDCIFSLPSTTRLANRVTAAAFKQVGTENSLTGKQQGRRRLIPCPLQMNPGSRSRVPLPRRVRGRSARVVQARGGLEGLSARRRARSRPRPRPW